MEKEFRVMASIECTVYAESEDEAWEMTPIICEGWDVNNVEIEED